MSYLTLNADRLVRDAVDAFLIGRLRPDPLPDTLYATKNSRYRILAGFVHEASDTSLMGAELVAWLFEQGGMARVDPSWTFGSRAIFVDRRSKHVVVTSRVTAKNLAHESRTPPRIAGIPAPPPIPSFKTSPSVAPPALVSLGGDDPSPASHRRPVGTEEDITKVDHTHIADADEVERLRASSKEITDAHDSTGDDLVTRLAVTRVGSAPDLRTPEDADEDDEIVEISASDILLQGEASRRSRSGIAAAKKSGRIAKVANSYGALPPLNPPKRR